MMEEPMFWIQSERGLSIQPYGILYFPKIKNNLDLQRNKIQLYSNQVL